MDPDTGDLRMGYTKVRFPSKNVSFCHANTRLGTFRGNRELYELLFLKLPSCIMSSEGVNVTNKQTYGEILKLTKAAHTNYDHKLGYNTSNSRKYREIIKPLLQHGMVTRSSKKGSGLPTKKQYNDKAVDYVHWNKPKELVDRLRLLWSSKQAGHTGHDNEILSLISELREEGIVY